MRLWQCHRSQTWQQAGEAPQSRTGVPSRLSSEWLQHCCREPWQAADPLLGMHVVLAHIRFCAGWQCVGHRHCRAKGIVAQMTAATAVLGCHMCVANGALHWRRQKCSIAAAGYNTGCVRVCCDGRSSAAQVGEACSSGRLTDMDCRFLRAFPSLTPAKKQTQDTCWQLAGNVVDTGRAFASRHLLSVLRNSVQQHTQ
jgi:hypothetical protein